MNKTLNINLGGVPFIIDENAFEILHQYLEVLKTKFNNAAERDEILHDIEARIAEMLNQQLEGEKKVVGIENVQSVIEVMGRPEDIAGEESSASANTSYNRPNDVFQTPVKRRLFRDPDDEKVAGVISGLCHYFGIDDPVWVRLAVIVLCFVSFGTVLLVYILLALVIPKAQTSAEKLQMKGEPVNISTIEKEIRGAVNRAGESLNSLRQETFFEKLWGLVVTITAGVLKLIAGIVIFIGLLIIFALIAALFGVSFTGNELLAHAPHLLVDNTTTLTAIKAGMVLFIGAPLVALIYAALRLLFGKRTQAPRLKWILIAVWWIGVFLMAFGGFGIAREFGNRSVKTEEMTLMQPAGGTLFVQLADSLGNKVPRYEEEEEDNYNVQITPAGVFINGTNLDEMEVLPIGEPWLQLMPSSNDSFYVQKVMTTRGRNKGDALTNSGYVIYNLAQTDSVLNLPPYVLLDKNGKYRAQKVRIRLAIPEGKQVTFADNIDRWAATVKGDSNYDDTEFANTTWTTSHGKVICLKGENHRHARDEDEASAEASADEKSKDEPSEDF